MHIWPSTGGCGRGPLRHVRSLDQGAEELPGGHAADVILHEVPLAFQHHLVGPRNSKAIAEVRQARL